VASLCRHWELFGKLPLCTVPKKYRPSKLSEYELNVIFELVKTHPTNYLDEYMIDFFEITQKHVSLPTLCRAMHQQFLGFTHKQLTINAKERNSVLEALFETAVVNRDEGNLFFGDEVHNNKKSIMRRMGWALSSSRAVHHYFRVRGKKFSSLGKKRAL
jgi:transposase